MYSVFSVNLDVGPHTASVTCKITENSLSVANFGIFAGDRRPCGSVAEHPLRDREVPGFESRPCHTKGIRNGTSGYLAWCSAL